MNFSLLKRHEYWAQYQKYLSKRREKKMKKLKDKTLFCVALVLLLGISAVAFLMPEVNAHTPPWTVPTTAYVSCRTRRHWRWPDTTIVVWVDRYSPTAGGGVGQRWNGFMITITKPDGTKETMGHGKCRSDRCQRLAEYSRPMQVGTYTIVFSWPGETCIASCS